MNHSKKKNQAVPKPMKMPVPKVIKVTVKNTKFKINENSGTYAELFTVCLQQVPRAGFTGAEIKQRINLVNIALLATKNKAEEFKVDLKDLSLIRMAVSTMKWVVLNMAFSHFTDYILELKPDEDE